MPRNATSTRAMPDKKVKQQETVAEETVEVPPATTAKPAAKAGRKPAAGKRQPKGTTAGAKPKRQPKAAPATDSDDADGEEKKTRVRKVVSLASVLETLKQAEKFCDTEIENRAKTKEPGAKTFKSIRKLIKEVAQRLPRLANQKRRNNRANTSVESGFGKEINISPELAKFLKVDVNTKLTRNDITRAICTYIHYDPATATERMKRWEYLNPEGERNLQNPSERKAILPDKALSALLGYDKYKKNVSEGKEFFNKTNKATGQKEQTRVEDDSLYYFVIQKLIQKHYIRPTKA